MTIDVTMVIVVVWILAFNVQWQLSPYPYISTKFSLLGGTLLVCLLGTIWLSFLLVHLKAPLNVPRFKDNHLHNGLFSKLKEVPLLLLKVLLMDPMVIFKPNRVKLVKHLSLSYW
jgi:hypothetical protein